MQVYPLYENAFRSHRGQTIESNHEESTKLYANFATIAEKNPMAWNFGKQTETETSIGTIGGGNRMICSPCTHEPSLLLELEFSNTVMADPLLMNAFNDVNLSSACIVVSTQYAERMGIPKEKWIYPLGAGRASDSDECRSILPDIGRIWDDRLIKNKNQFGTARTSTLALQLPRR